MFLLTVAAAAITISGLLAPEVDLQVSGTPNRGLTVLESNYRIEYPERIVFNLLAPHQPDVESVRLYYSVGSLDTTVYARPTRYSNHDRLAAEFIVNTANGGFIPQGVDINYHYVLADSEGRELKTEQFSFVFLDPRYRWRRLDLEDFTVFWHNRPESAVRRVTEEVSAQLVDVRRLFGLESDLQFRAVLINGLAEARRSFPRVSQRSEDVALYGGFAFGDYGALVLAGLGGDGLIHELTHLMLAEALDSPRARVPDWLNEGLAMYFESGRHREVGLIGALESGRLIPIRHMGNVPGKPEDVRLFYAQSASIVRFLVDGYGEPKMSQLLAEVNAGRDIDTALKVTYGFDVDRLDDEWRMHLAGFDPPRPTVDLGTLGTAVLIGGALATTGVTLLVRWLRRSFSTGEHETL